MTQIGDVRSAGQLLGFALDAAQRPKEGSTYRELLDRYRTDRTWADVVDAAAEGLGLYVRGTTQLGLLLAGDPDGPFAVTVENSGLRVRSNQLLKDRRVYGLVITALAALAYPNGDALTEVAVVTVRAPELESFLTKRINAILERGDEAGDQLDVQLVEAAAEWLVLPEVLPGEGGRMRQGCRRFYAERVLEWLIEQHRARREASLSDSRGHAYTLNDRFRIGIAELAETAVFQVLATSPRDGTSGDGEVEPRRPGGGRGFDDDEEG